MDVRAVLLAMAAASALATGARATDAVVADPNQASDPQGVNPCTAYGAGFFQLPGTNTCARLGGQLRYDINVNSNSGHSSHGRSTLNLETITE